METGDLNNAQGLEAQRQEVIETLQDSFAVATLDEESFEQRLESCLHAQSAGELQGLVQDLSPPSSLARVSSTLPAVPSRDWDTSWVVMSNQTRRLHGELEGDQRVVSMMGELTVDLRDAKLEGKPALLELVAVMGNIIVLVPPGAGVDVKGPVLFGNLRQRLSPLSSSSPKIRLRTKVFMGNVEIVECRSSESVKQAKRRHRVESKAVEGAKRRAIAEKSQG